MLAALTLVGSVTVLGASCSPVSNWLGRNRAALDSGLPIASSVTPSSEPPDAGPAPSMSEPPDAGPSPSPSDAMVPSPPAPTTVDASDSGADSGAPPVTPSDGGPEPMDEYPNHFVDVLGLSPEEVNERLQTTFEQLFFGDPNSQRIYVETSEEEAYVWDVFHDDTRMDAVGYGLLITVQFDRQAEFDRIWTFATRRLRIVDGASSGYFNDICSKAGDNCSDRIATLGTFYTATALLFAEGRWGNASGSFDYGSEARQLLSLMLEKETQNQDIETEVTNLFDEETHLPYRVPMLPYTTQTMPGIVLPAFFQIWWEQTGNPFWQEAAQAAREFLHAAAHPNTGLYPAVCLLEGSVVAGEELFDELSYSTGLALALDATWHGEDPEHTAIANRWVEFFATFGGAYPALYLYSGEPQNPNPSGALVAMNGAIASIATATARENFIRTVWNTPTPVGAIRYFDGVMHLLSMMHLSGMLRPY